MNEMEIKAKIFDILIEIERLTQVKNQLLQMLQQEKNKPEKEKETKKEKE
jgi:hypothetical protein